MDRDNRLDLFDHNIDAYEQVKKAFDSGEDVVGIVHATGTGKSYVAMQLAFDNRDKKTLYIVPSNSISEHIQKIIELNPNVDLEKDFSNLEFATYQSFVNMGRDEIEKLDIDLIILDEFHHIGAPIWGSRIQTLLDTHENSKIFGMTAYTVRDRGTSYERDMANPDGDELFSNKIVSTYDLCDAMVDGVLPKPIYKSAYIKLLEMAIDLEARLAKFDKSSEEYKQYKKIIDDAKKRIHHDSVGDAVIRNVRADGKYIYFCPPKGVDGINDIESIKKEALKWFKEIADERDIVFYTSTSEMKSEGDKNRDAFYNDRTLDGKDVSNKLRVMFAINQYNEGVHAPNIDGVIMGRGTSSDIVYFEQLGRALSVRGDTHLKFNEYMSYSMDKLIELCKARSISYENLSKEDLVQKLIAPTVIDLTNNLDYIRYLENNLKDRILKKKRKKGILYDENVSIISDPKFYLEIVDSDVYEELRYVLDRLNLSWEDKFEVAKKYYEHYGNLIVPTNFRTINGVDRSENGFSLTAWLHFQRGKYKKGTLSQNKKDKLDSIGMVWNVSRDYENVWEEMFRLTKEYYDEHGDLLIPRGYKVYSDYLKKDVFLKVWIYNQRLAYDQGKIRSDRKEKLDSIGMLWRLEDENAIVWDSHYEIAKKYYEKNGDLSVPAGYKTPNGIDKTLTGFDLGRWVNIQRKKYKEGELSKNQISKLEKIGMDWNRINDLESRWEMMYGFAKDYYEKNGDLFIPRDYIVICDGEEYPLGSWLLYQRKKYKEGKLQKERIEKLDEIKMLWTGTGIYDKQWIQIYELAKKYYDYYGNLLIKQSFKTSNGVDDDPNGVLLGIWISTQRAYYKTDKLSDEQIKKLEKIGMVWDASVNYDERWEKSYELAKKYYAYHGNLLVPTKFRTNNGYDEDAKGYGLGAWICSQRYFLKTGKLTDERKAKLELIGMEWSAVESIEEAWDRAYKLATNYYNYYGDLLVPNKYKTSNGVDEDPNGFGLGSWVSNHRVAYKKGKVDKDRIDKLNQIGMVWDASKVRRRRTRKK